MTGADKWVKALEKAFLCLSGLGLLTIMIVIDVVMRYFFSSPLSWSYDLVSLYLVTLVCFMALADTFRRGDHIKVDLFERLRGLSYTTSEWLLMAFVGTFGLAMGTRGCGPIVASLSNHPFAGPPAAASYKMIYAASMVGAAIGAWGSGFLHDASASYRPAMLVATLGIVLAAMPFAFQRALRAGLHAPEARELGVP